MCLSLPVLGGFEEGEPAQVWNCIHTNMLLQHSWAVDTLRPGPPSAYRIISLQSGKCLEAGNNNGDAVHQAKCNGAKNQEWSFEGPLTATFAIKSLDSGKCIQVRPPKTGSNQDGDTVEQWDCAGAATNQAWKMTNITPLAPPLDTAKGELGNACNPWQGPSQCGPDAQCMEVNLGQYICGKSCSKTAPCPSGFKCTLLPGGASTYLQCVPTRE